MEESLSLHGIMEGLSSFSLLSQQRWDKSSAFHRQTRESDIYIKKKKKKYFADIAPWALAMQAVLSHFQD